jgi:acyl-CoA hydrolase
MEIAVDVRGEDATTGRTWPCVSGFLTFVAFKDGKPAPVPPLLVETAEERAELEAAITRRKQRLERRTPR